MDDSDQLINSDPPNSVEEPVLEYLKILHKNLEYNTKIITRVEAVFTLLNGVNNDTDLFKIDDIGFKTVLKTYLMPLTCLENLYDDYIIDVIIDIIILHKNQWNFNQNPNIADLLSEIKVIFGKEWVWGTTCYSLYGSILKNWNNKAPNTNFCCIKWVIDNLDSGITNFECVRKVKNIYLNDVYICIALEKDGIERYTKKN